MKLFKFITLLLVAMLCLTACQTTKTPSTTPEPPVVEPNPNVTPDPASNIPPATTDKEPPQADETYTAAGKPEKSYHISPDIDLDAMGITEGSMIELEYTVDENGIKKVKTISIQH